MVRHQGLLRLGLPDIDLLQYDVHARERAVVHGLERQEKGTFVLSLRLLLLGKERKTGGMEYLYDRRGVDAGRSAGSK
jgi:hypothetical protein